MIGCGSGLTPYHYVNNFHRVEVPTKVIPIYIDKDFGNGDLIAIDNAIKQWNYALNGYIELEVMTTKFDMSPMTIKRCQEGNCWIILKINSSSYLVHDSGPFRVTLAYCNCVGGYVMYMIRDRMENDDVYPIMLHELGHLLGSEHTSVGLMYPTYSKEAYRCINYNAMLNVAIYNGLSIERLNYCVEGSLK
jgi:hypothetical protein